MKQTDKDFLKMILQSDKITLKELEVEHRINIAVYNARKEILQNRIDSLEKQLTME